LKISCDRLYSTQHVASMTQLGTRLVHPSW